MADTPTVSPESPGAPTQLPSPTEATVAATTQFAPAPEHRPAGKTRVLLGLMLASAALVGLVLTQGEGGVRRPAPVLEVPPSAESTGGAAADSGVPVAADIAPTPAVAVVGGAAVPQAPPSSSVPAVRDLAAKPLPKRAGSATFGTRLTRSPSLDERLRESAARARLLPNGSDATAGLTPCPIATIRKCNRNCGSSAMPCFTADDGRAADTGCSCPAPQCLVVADACWVSPHWVAEAFARDPSLDDGLCEADIDRPRTAAANATTFVRTPPAPSTFDVRPLHPAIAAGSTWLYRHQKGGIADLAAPPGGRGSGDSAEAGLTPATPGTYAGSVSATDGLYTLRNVCVQPRGPLVVITEDGHAKTERMEPFRGVFEMHMQFKKSHVPFKMWIEAPIGVQLKPGAPPPVFRNDSAFVFLVGLKSDNVNHVFHRAGTALAQLRHRYGAGFRERVIGIHAVDAGAEEEQAVKKLNGMDPWRALLTRRWFAVNVTTNSGRAPITAGDEVSAESALECFRELLVYQQCSGWCKDQAPYKPKTSKNAVLRGPPTLGSQFNMAWSGVRSPNEFLQSRQIREAAVACYGLPPRERANTEAPRVLLIWRSSSRVFYGFHALQEKISLYLNAKGAASFTIVEVSRVSNRWLAEAAGRTDILLGAIGAGLTWSNVMPPGSVVVEFYRRFGCASMTNPPFATACEYAGASYVGRREHMGVRLIRDCGVPEVDIMSAMWLHFDGWRRVIDGAFCRLRARPNSTTAYPAEGFSAMPLPPPSASDVDKKCAVDINALCKPLPPEGSPERKQLIAGL